MRNSVSNPISTGLRILQVLLYLLAIAVLAAGVYYGYGLISGAGHIIETLLNPPKILGVDIISPALDPIFSRLFVNLGWAAVIVTTAVSALLFLAGSLFGYIAALERRIARLEAKTPSPP